MTDAEMFQFLDIFRSVVRVFPLRGDEHEIRDVGASYFKAFRRYPLRDIQAGADTWISSGKKFPKPAEWIESIPRRVSLPLSTLNESETREHRHAEALGYEDAPCECVDCLKAEVSEKPIRFVPDVTDYADEVRVIDAYGRVVCAGHWAHGFELLRWYQARGDFWNAMVEKFPDMVSGVKRLVP